MKQGVFRFAILIVLVCISICGRAYDFKVDGIYYKISSDNSTNVEVIYSNAVANSYSGDVVIPSTVTYMSKTYTVSAIFQSAFDECTELTSIILPNTITKIGTNAFYNCAKLTSIEIPKSVTEIGNSAFRGCTNLASVNIPDSVKTIEYMLFDSCSGLKSITIPDNITEIGVGAFEFCTGLTSIKIPNSVNKIGDYAFDGCSGLLSVEISKSVTSIGSFAFRGCSNIREIHSQGSTPAVVGVSGFKDIKTTNCKLYVPYGSKETYAFADVWSDFVNIIEEESGRTVDPVKCATPTITYENGHLLYSTTTEGATVRSTVKVSDAKTSTELDVPLDLKYEVTAYAIKDDCISETATYTLDLSGNAPAIRVDTVIVEKEVPVEVHDTTYVDKIVEVPVEVHDTTYVDKIIEKEVIKEVTVEVHDTTYVDKIVEVEVPVEKLVEIHDTIYVYDDSRSEIILPSGDTMILYIRDGIVYIENAPLGDLITSYTLCGEMYEATRVKEVTTAITLPRGAIYIIKVGEKTFKVKI